MTDPVILVVDHDPEELAAFERALGRRYGADFKVVTERSPGAALELLERLARRGEEVALVAADLRLPGTDGVEFLEGVMNFSSYTIASGHGYAKTIPQ